MHFTDQSRFTVRFEWGAHGLAAVADGCVAIVIVDVLSFTTCVDVAVARGAVVHPYRWKDASAERFAEAQRAELAGSRGGSARYTLSPDSLATVDAHTRIVLPSPNGATLSLLAAERATTIAGCVRNAGAVAHYAATLRGPIAVIACGERWSDDSVRACWEDTIGAGAILDTLWATGLADLSPEATLARDAFRASRTTLRARMLDCASGRELVERGYPGDVDSAAQLDVSDAVPVLRELAFTNARA